MGKNKNKNRGQETKPENIGAQTPPPVIDPANPPDTEGAAGNIPPGAAAAGANDAGHESQTPPPVAPQDSPEVKATAEQLQSEGVNVKGLDGGIDESTQTPPAAPPPDPAKVAAQSQTQADTNAAAAAFSEHRKKAVAGICAAMKTQGVHYDEAYVAVMPSVRDATNESELTVALHNTMAVLMKRHKDVVVVGGDKEAFVLAGGTPLKPASAKDMWKCPRCGTHNSMQFTNDELHPFEVCGMCGVVARKDVAQNLYRIVRDGKTVKEINQEEQKDA